MTASRDRETDRAVIAHLTLGHSMVETAAANRSDRSFIGHPTGLGWLSFCEFWERFSYYGMQALLVLYMTHSLLNPGHVEHVWGFEPFRRGVESIYGAGLSPQALASAIFGLYTGFVYLTPIGGVFIADRFLGRTRTVALGASLMALGHFLMAFEASFLLALSCLLVGVGCFKGNIATQVGDLYGPGDDRRADAFQIFLFVVQVAVIASPFVCGTLGQVYGWHYGFGAAGVGMLIGLGIYLTGRAHFPAEQPRRRDATSSARPPLMRADAIKIAILVAILPVLAVAMVGNQEISNAYLIWGEQNYQLVFFGKTMPITWILSFGSIISAGTIVVSVGFWRWFGTRWTEPDEITKVTVGVMLGSTAPLLLAAASMIIAATHVKVGLGWAVAFEVVNDLGFANVFRVAIALYSRAAPKGLTGLMVGLFYLHLFMGNLFVGWVGGLLEKMPATSFWLLHTGLMVGAALILLAVRITAGKILAPAYDAPVQEELAEAVA
jgi:POT family proton-dependent oligopeptide transporter